MSKSKTHIHIVQEDPLLLTMSKNKRPVGLGVAIRKLAELYPDIPEEAWIIQMGNKTTRAGLRKDWHSPVQNKKGSILLKN